MNERIFTIFQGPDAGSAFSVGDQPISLGRDKMREVVLHDDRASRLHTIIRPEGESIVVADQGSSNGTFVNGELIQSVAIEPGDVIVIGGSHIVYGRCAPTAERLAALLANRESAPRPAGGTETSILPPLPDLSLARASLGDLLEAVAEAARPAARPLGYEIGLEIELQPDAVTVDSALLYKALAGVAAGLVAALPVAHEALLILRASPDPQRHGFQVETLCMGVPVPRESIAARRHEPSIVDARRIALAHGGTLELLPLDAPDTLARLRLPLEPPNAARATIVRK